MTVIELTINELEALAANGVENMSEEQREDYNNLIADLRVIDPEGEYDYV